MVLGRKSVKYLYNYSKLSKGGQSKKFVPHHPPRRARPDLKTKLKMPTLLKNFRISLILMPAHAKVFGNERQSPLGVGEATT